MYQGLGPPLLRIIWHVLK